MTYQFEKELLNVDLSGISVKISPKHPKSVELTQKTSEILMAAGIPFKFSDLTDSCLYLFPHFKNDDLCIVFLIWFIWAFLLDDHVERNPKDFSKWYNILEGEECLGDGKIEKLYKLFLKVANEAFINPKYLTGLLCVVKEWLESAEKFQKLSSGEMSDQELIEARFLDIAALPCFYFIQIDAGLQVTKELESDENWDKLRYYLILQLTIINDLFSLKKDVKAGQGKSNYVYVKMKNNNISAQEAVERLSIEAENAEQMTRYYGQKLKESHEIAGLDTYVNVLIAIMAGNMYWSSKCERYNNF